MPGNIVDRIDDRVVIRRVLCSVFDKTGLDALVPGLVSHCPGVVFYSTGGTHAHLARLLGNRAATQLVQVSDYTGQPETQGGLVKTLDFKIYLGLLTETYNEAHRADMARTGAVDFDMVVVNLYPFGQVAANANAGAEEMRANIDIGGPCMLRASAKNWLRVASVSAPTEYEPLLALLAAQGGALTVAQRFALSRRTFARTAQYDAAIAEALERVDPARLLAEYPASTAGA